MKSANVHRAALSGVGLNCLIRRQIHLPEILHVCGLLAVDQESKSRAADLIAVLTRGIPVGEKDGDMGILGPTKLLRLAVCGRPPRS